MNSSPPDSRPPSTRKVLAGKHDEEGQELWLKHWRRFHIPTTNYAISESYSKALAASTAIVDGLESRAGPGVTRLRQRIQPFTVQASEGLKKAAETADRFVVDPLMDEYKAGGSQAVLMTLLCMFKDAVLGFLSGLRCASDRQDSHDVREDRHIASMHSKSSSTVRDGSDQASLGTYLLSKVDSLFYFPLVITLKSRAASVFTPEDPREDDSHSYVYCLAWEVGSWTVENGRRLWAYLVQHSPTTKLMHLIRRFTAPEVNFAGISECLAKKIPPTVHPLMFQMSRLREVYTCERRRSTTVRHSYVAPSDQPATMTSSSPQPSPIAETSTSHVKGDQAAQVAPPVHA